MDIIYPKLIQSVLDHGHQSSPRGQGVRELYNVGWKLEDAKNSIIQNPERKMNYAYAVIEMLGLFQEGQKNVEPYCYYNSVMKNFLNPETGKWDGSYAQRLMMYDQLPRMYEILKADPNSRRAVIGIYNPAHDFHDYESRDICCTLSLIFRIRKDKLHLTCTMRSNDVLLGVPYDLTQFCFLQSVLATWLGIEVGEYYHFTANLHAYEHDREKLKKIYFAEYDFNNPGAPLTTMPQWDIKNIDETYADIEKFFEIENTMRKGDSTDIALAWELQSEVLRTFLADIIAPYIMKKKMNKKSLLIPARAS